jgi:hypothetical protein
LWDAVETRSSRRRGQGLRPRPRDFPQKHVSRAVIDDFKRVPELHQSNQEDWPYDLTNALNYDYSGIIAQTQPQSSVQPVRLAHVDAQTQFQPDAIKTAYGKPYEQYTGAFTPYRKENGNEMA